MSKERVGIYVTPDEMQAFEKFAEDRKALESKHKAMIKSLMDLHHEEKEALYTAQNEMWEQIYHKYNLDKNYNWTIDRKSGEIAMATKEDHEEHCDDPNCPACRMKDSIRGLLNNLLGRGAVEVQPVNAVQLREDGPKVNLAAITGSPGKKPTVH